MLKNSPLIYADSIALMNAEEELATEFHGKTQKKFCGIL